jgi:hypothetical protein
MEAINKSFYFQWIKKIACIVVGSCMATFCQTFWPLELQQTIKGNFAKVYADNLLNVYTVNANNQIKKYNNKGDSVAVYNNLTQYGNISHIDVTNGLKILVYYKDFAIINVLDRFLKPLTTIQLRQQNILQASAICLSYDGQIWVFDEVEYKLKKIDETGKLLLETPDCRIVFPAFKAPEKIIDADGLLYTYEATTGFLVFDYYGAFKQQLSYTHWQQVQVSNGWLSGIQQQQIQYVQPKQLQQIAYTLPSNIINSKQINRINQHCIILQPNGISVYKILL